MSLTTLEDFLFFAEKCFIEAELYFGHGTDNAWDEAVALARHVLEFPVDADNSLLNRNLKEEEIQSLKILMQRRIKDRIPMPYLTHEAWFAGLLFYIDERTIIPRSPLGGLIQDQLLPWSVGREMHRILDLCTGSGCMAIALAEAFPLAKIDAVDLSREALEVAEKNIKLHNLEDRIRLIRADLFDACADLRYDLIISNPPYVDRLDMENLPLEFQWEPKMALAAGEDGLQIVRRILRDAPEFLTEKGLLIVEVGNSMEALMEAYPQIPFIWLDFEHGGHGVFLLYSEDKACWQIS